MKKPIGIFDSGYGGLTILKEIVKELPTNDYIYLGDNARTPYGTRSFETVYEYTLENVKRLFDMGCELVILACNTASAKALRNIQQKDLPLLAPNKRVLGVIRPTAEIAGSYTKSKHIGVLGTTGTVSSGSYPIEIENFSPETTVTQEACPMWVSLIENNQLTNQGADFFVKQNIENLLHKAPKIDTIILGCTHYPLLIDTIRKHLPNSITVIPQGEIVAKSLGDYLNRHPEMNKKCSKNSCIEFYTTGATEQFNTAAGLFFGKTVDSKAILK